MKTKDFFGKFLSGYLWGNLLAMAVVVAALCFGVKYGLELYTHHGEGVKVPDLSKMRFREAELLLESDGLFIMVSDSGYNKRLPADCILTQTPGAGTYVKKGHVIYAIVRRRRNSPHWDSNCWSLNTSTVSRTGGWVEFSRQKRFRELRTFTKNMIAFRKEHKILSLPNPMEMSDYRHKGIPDLSYHGKEPWTMWLSDDMKSIGILYDGAYAGEESDVMLLFNFYFGEDSFALPKLNGRRK